MEAATKERELSGDKAQRIVDAMRESVAKRGAAGSTFEQVAREAGVSRGLLHYYFGTKEQLLVEVVRRDTELRVERLDDRLGSAKTVDGVVGALVTSLSQTIAVGEMVPKRSLANAAPTWTETMPTTTSQMARVTRPPPPAAPPRASAR